MAESKIVVKDNHLLFEDGRFYVTETQYKDGRQTDFPKKIDVTDDVKKAIMPKTFIDIDKFICSLIGRSRLTGFRVPDIFISSLRDQGLFYSDGSLMRIGSKKCEGKLKEMLDEKVLAIDSLMTAKENTEE